MSAQILFYDAKQPFGEFSNFYKLKCGIQYNGKVYPTSEHLYQAQKFMGPDATERDLEYAEKIRVASTPNKARVLAKLKTGGGYKWRLDLNVLIRAALADGAKARPDWHDVKLRVMREALELKFGANRDCRELLLSTGDAPLAEHTHRDMFWGDGDWKGDGQNHLGKLLQELRERLRARKERLTKRPLPCGTQTPVPKTQRTMDEFSNSPEAEK